MKYTREAFSSQEDAQCTICLGKYQEKEVLRVVPKCGHSFHLSCIDVWLRKQSTCPVCRPSVEDPFTEKYTTRPAVTLEMDQTINSPEILTDHSQQWLLPVVAQRAEGNGSDQVSNDVVSDSVLQKQERNAYVH